MESWLLFLIFILISLINLMLVVEQVEAAAGGGVSSCIEEERKALLEIKASLQDSDAYDKYWSSNSSNKVYLPTWVDGGDECCEWERVECDSTTGHHVTHLSLTNMLFLPYSIDYYYLHQEISWELNFSIFRHFEELKSLDLSYNSIRSTDFEMMPSLKKLELLNLSYNHIKKDFFPSLSALTSLKILDLGYNYVYGGPVEDHDISEFAALENLEVLDLTGCGYHGTFQMQGSHGNSIMKKLKILNLEDNDFNESVIPSLRSLPSLKSLNLRLNDISGSLPAEDISHLTELEKLDLSDNNLQGTPSVQGCKSLLRLKRLETIVLAWNKFNNKSIISCLSFLPSLKTLDLSSSLRGMEAGSFPTQELLSLHDLKVLLLGFNEFNGTLPMEALASLHNLEVLDLSGNNFTGSIPSTIRSLSSLRAISLASNELNGSLPLDHGLCDLENLHELDLSQNMLHGNLPECFSRLSYLKLFDISSNQFNGALPPSLMANLTSLEYIDFSHNQLTGSLSFSILSNHTKLEVFLLENDNDMLEVETEEPTGWIPMFQLKVLVLSNCNMNRRKGSVGPSFLLYQHELVTLDMSRNYLKGHFPIWLIKNNARLEYIDMSSNLLDGAIPRDMPRQLPNIMLLNLSCNSLDGAIPSPFGNLSELYMLDLSHTELSGEVPIGILGNLPKLIELKLSNNRLRGEELSGNYSFGYIETLQLDGNNFTGKIVNDTPKMTSFSYLRLFDISNNFFTGNIPGWISNLSSSSCELVLRNNRFEGEFPCGTTNFTFLDISQNSFSGPLPFCSNWMKVRHLHLGSNKFTGSIPTFFRNLTSLSTLDVRNNSLSGRIPTFLGELYNLRILLLGKNNFIGSIPNRICQLSHANLIDLSSNSLSGSIPSCLHNITTPRDLAFDINSYISAYVTTYSYKRVTYGSFHGPTLTRSGTQDEVLFTTKSMSLPYKGEILDYMSGLDLSCNKLVGEIPPELGMLTQIHSLNLSHNQLIGPIPVQFSNLTNIESLDLSSNCLSGNIPLELIELHSLASFNVSHNNLSGRLPEFTAQFGTFTMEIYEGNPLLCGPPLEKKCTTAPHVTDASTEEGNDEKWFDIDMTSFYGSCGSTWFVFILGFAAVLYTNPNWRRRWLNLIEECMYTCYYFLYDSIRKLSVLFHK